MILRLLTILEQELLTYRMNWSPDDETSFPIDIGEDFSDADKEIIRNEIKALFSYIDNIEFNEESMIVEINRQYLEERFEPKSARWKQDKLNENREYYESRGV